MENCWQILMVKYLQASSSVDKERLQTFLCNKYRSVKEKSKVSVTTGYGSVKGPERNSVFGRIPIKITHLVPSSHLSP